MEICDYCSRGRGSDVRLVCRVVVRLLMGSCLVTSEVLKGWMKKLGRACLHVILPA
jgi:hypothetical protein